ncbi:hypothetical protein [Microcoleus anatoxicus]|uniref:Uncharacterized protein n=1 Tax=Microcoleus anatoxicus PTRS2 TaxID=2705321 RepID=A0ABU8YRN9_9CYAN
MPIPYKNAMHPAFVPHNSRNRCMSDDFDRRLEGLKEYMRSVPFLVA